MESAQVEPKPNRPGCFIVRTEDGVHIIEHTRDEMGCMNSFISAWLTVWTFCCLFLIVDYLNGGEMEDGSPMPLSFVMFFVAAWCLVAWILLYAKYARKTFAIRNDVLEARTQVLALRWGMSIPRQSVIKVCQVKDGGENDDSFPSWGLNVECSEVEDNRLHRVMTTSLVPGLRRGTATRTRSLLRRQPYEQSRWLGIVIAGWADTELELLERPE